MHAASPAPRPIRVLIVANGDVHERDVDRLVDPRVRDVPHETLVVAPAINSFLGRPVGDAAQAERDAELRIVHAVLSLSAAGFRSSGIVGDADPLLAIEDALCVFPADEVVVAVGPDPGAGWLGEKLAERARARVTTPVRSVTLDTHAAHPAAA